MIVATGLSAGLLSVPALGSTSRPHQPRLLATLEKETATRAKWGLQSDQPYLARIAARSDLQLSSVGAHLTPQESRELARRWRISEKMGSVIAYARRALGRAYAGAYVDQTRGSQVVVRGTAPTFSVRPLKALLPPGTDVVYRASVHGWQQLRALQLAIEKDFTTLAREGIMVTAVGSVASADKVEIAVSPESRQDAEGILSSRYGEAIAVLRQGALQPQGRQFNYYNRFAGLYMNSGRGAKCTAGFNGQDRTGSAAYFAVTAGHCGYGGWYIGVPHRRTPTL